MTKIKLNGENEMNKKKSLLTAQQVSTYFNIPLRTVHRLSKKGIIKSFKIGGQWRYLRNDIRRYGSKTVMSGKVDFLTAEEVSKFLDIPLRTLYRLSKQGKIKAFKIGDKWRYNKEDIKHYGLADTDFSKEPARIHNNLIERRAYPRINSNFICHYSINLPPFRKIKMKAILKNLSAGGLFIISSDNQLDKIEIDDPVELSFVLNNKTKDINIVTEGRIIRKDNIGLGIKFRNLSNEDKYKIVKYVG